MWRWAVCLAVAALLAGCDGAGAGAARLVCYVTGRENTDYNECTHLIYTGNARGNELEDLLKEYRISNPRLKIILRINEVDKDLRNLLKSKYIQGLEIHDVHRTLNRTKVVEAVETAKKTLASSGGGPLFLSIPSHPELLAKYYDMRNLVKKVDLMMVQTHALGAMKKMTYHPSRLSGLWDMMNTDSVVDLVVGLGVPASKIVVSLPATAQQFTLQNETLSTPGSPAVADEPKEIDQIELCRLLQRGRWTLERDQDLSAPYAFKGTTWISFEDASSVDVKGKYARVRGLAGLALHDADRDLETPCGPILRASLTKVLNQQSRAPRAAVLRSLEQEILSAPRPARAIDALQVSPYRITQVVDSDGVIHSIREDTRTEFSCTRQGYFVHPRSCARFYRCVKFDQTSSDYTVFEFDCPAGLAFDSRYEVCVWPGSLPNSQACPGSSEIAPVPHTRFVCPAQEGYYADPENCRWFFACLDHGQSALVAYEFRCPFGLGFDASRLKCDWPWLVPACGQIARYEAEAHGFSGAILTGATGFRGQTADAVNVAAHNSLASGASVNNLVGIQSGLLAKQGDLDPNFISLRQAGGDSSLNKKPKYTTGSIILDDYRQPTKSANGNSNILEASQINLNAGNGNNGQGYSGSSFGQTGQQYVQYQNANSASDNSGQYVHDPSGDYGVPYRHEEGAGSPYVHQDSKYTDQFDVGRYTQDSDAGTYSQNLDAGRYSQTLDAGRYSQNLDAGRYSQTLDAGRYSQNLDAGRYSQTLDAGRYSQNLDAGRYIQGADSGKYNGKYTGDNNGRYVHDRSGAYIQNGNAGSFVQNDNSGVYVQKDNFKYVQNDNSGAYRGDNSGQYKNDNSGQYVAGIYQGEGQSVNNKQLYEGYADFNNGQYVSDNKVYTGASHTLTNGAVNVGLVGKTTLVDAPYNDQFNYKLGDGFGQIQYQGAQQINNLGHLGFVDQPSVSISHIGTAAHNLDGYNFVASPTDGAQYNLVPTTPTPFTVTTSLPAVTTYRTTFVPEAPRTSIKQIFGVTQPPLTYVQPTLIPVTVAPRVQVTDYNQGFKLPVQTVDKSESGYSYNKPTIKFEEGVTYTTPAPLTVSTFRPQEFGPSQQTLHNVESVGFEYSTPVPVTEEPFKKVVAYTTGTPLAFPEPSIATYTPRPFSIQTVQQPQIVEFSTVQPPQIVEFSTVQPPTVSTYQPSFSTVQPPTVSTYQPSFEQGLHQVNVNYINSHNQGESGYDYSRPAVQFQSTTPAPATVSGSDAYSTQTLHRVNTEAQNGYKYTKPAVQEGYQYSTPAPQLVAENKNEFSQQTVHTKQETGYEYSKPVDQLELQKVSVAYPTPATVVAANAQSFSQQTLHNINSPSFVPVSTTPRVELYAQPTFTVSTPQVPIFEQPAVSLLENPFLKYAQRVTPAPLPTYVPQVFAHQTLHQVQANKLSLPSASFEYINPNYVVQPKIQYEYTTARPTIEVSTIQPQQQVEYTTARPDIRLQQVVSTIQPQVQLEYTTAKPTIPVESVVSTTPQPHVFSHQTLHNVDAAKINAFAEETGYEYQKPLVKLEEAPKRVIQYTTPAPVTVSTYRPQFYRQQILQKVETPLVPQVQFRQPAVSFYQNPLLKYVANTTPRPVVTKTFQPVHYQTVYQPEIQRDFEAIHSGNAFSDATLVSQQAFRLGTGEINAVPVVSTTPTPLPAFEERFIPNQRQQFIQTQDRFDYKPFGYSQQFEIPQTYSDNVGSVHFSEFPGSKIVTKYDQVNAGEELIQPFVSTTAAPIITSTYRPFSVSTSTEYLAPLEPVTYSREYLPPKEEKEYVPSSSTTARPIITSTTEAPVYKVESTTSREYLPPLDKVEPHVVNFESFGFKTFEGPSTPLAFNPYEIPYQQNILVENNNNNLLGFGTVGPDAGLVSPVTYTTAAPFVVSSESYKSTTAIPLEVSPVTIPVRSLRPKVYRPFITSTTELPTYKSFESTTFRAPEYLPPIEDTISSTLRPVTRQQNIVVQTAKSNQLGFGTVGPDAGLVSTFSTATPLVVSSTEPFFSSTTFAPPIQEELVEDIRPRIPLRRVKPKVAVVTKINDFNPLLVRKLGAVCSCQSPIVVLRGRRPISPQAEYVDYEGDYEINGRGDIGNEALNFNSERLFSPVSTTPAPLFSSSFNPIIVPDDSYYQDIAEGSNLEETAAPVVSIRSSTTPRYSTSSSTEKSVKVRPRVKSVTVTPTYESILKNEQVTPATLIQDAGASIESQSFNRYGPGGYRGRDETLQGTVDCQRAGLFRHPKHCNKFYSCRFDDTKQRFTLHVFNCPVQLSFDPNLGACNWPSQGPACQGDTLLTNTL